MIDNDFSTVKVGDKVIVKSRGSRTLGGVHVVSRLSNTMVIVESGKNLVGVPYEKRFRKIDGSEVGSNDAYFCSYLEKWTQEKEDAIRTNNKRHKIMNKIKEFDFSTLSLIELEKIDAVIESSKAVKSKE